MPSSHEVWGPDDCVWYNFAILNFLPSNTDLGVDYSKRQGIWVSSNKQQKWPRKQLNRAKRTTFAWIRQIHKFHMSSTETNQPLRTQRGLEDKQTHSVGSFIDSMLAVCCLTKTARHRQGKHTRRTPTKTLITLTQPRLHTCTHTHVIYSVCTVDLNRFSHQYCTPGSVFSLTMCWGAYQSLAEGGLGTRV